MHSNLRRLAAVGMTLGVVGCGEAEPHAAAPLSIDRPQAIAGSSQPASTERFSHIKDDDPAISAAMEKARANVATFIAAIQAPTENQKYFAVKTPFASKRPDGTERHEHIWLIDATYDGKVFEGIVGNEPAYTTEVKIGQSVTVEPEKLSDWMYIDDGKLVGGETIRALFAKMSPDEQKRFQASAHYVIE